MAFYCQAISLRQDITSFYTAFIDVNIALFTRWSTSILLQRRPAAAELHHALFNPACRTVRKVRDIVVRTILVIQYMGEYTIKAQSLWILTQ
jgi:hypothetical protein